MVMCSTMEKVGRAMEKGEAGVGCGGVGLVIVEEILPYPTPKCQRALRPERPHPSTLLLPRMCWAVRTSCGSESRSWKTRCRTCARSIETCLTSPPASSPGLQNECRTRLLPWTGRQPPTRDHWAKAPRPTALLQALPSLVPCLDCYLHEGSFVCVDPLVSVVSSWCYFVFNKRSKSLSS